MRSTRRTRKSVSGMWQIKTFPTKKKMDAFLDKQRDNIQYVQIFLNKGYGIEYRKLRWVY